MIGVFGGTFDPVHYGHLRTAWEIQQALGLSQVRMIPCAVPPHRGEPVASGAQRLLMLQMALEDSPGFIADERELLRGGPSYMVDTLQSLREELGRQPMCLILGQDAFNGIDRWHKWQRLIDLAHIVVMQRPGSKLPSMGAVADLMAACGTDDAADLSASSAGRVYLQPVTQLDIAATQLRAAMRTDGSEALRFLVPDVVRHYIAEHGLYCDSED